MTTVVVTATLEVDLGDDFEISAAFTGTDGNPADPTTVTMTLYPPDGTTVDYVVADPQVTNPEVGTFVGLFVATQAGQWGWRIHGTGGGVEAAEVGSVDVRPNLTDVDAPYDRWGIDVDAAIAVTGSANLSTARLLAAEEEIVDALGWRPDPDDYGSADPTAAAHDVRVRAFGRAVAWQAAYRADVAASAGDGAGARIVSEDIGNNYSVQYGGGGVLDEVSIVARARTLLGRAGWFAPVRSGRTHTFPR